MFARDVLSKAKDASRSLSSKIRKPVSTRLCIFLDVPSSNNYDVRELRQIIHEIRNEVPIIILCRTSSPHWKWSASMEKLFAEFPQIFLRIEKYRDSYDWTRARERYSKLRKVETLTDEMKREVDLLSIFGAYHAANPMFTMLLFKNTEIGFSLTKNDMASMEYSTSTVDHLKCHARQESPFEVTIAAHAAAEALMRGADTAKICDFVVTAGQHADKVDKSRQALGQLDYPGMFSRKKVESPDTPTRQRRNSASF